MRLKTAAVLTGSLLLSVTGCQQKPSAAPRPQASKIIVHTASDGIHLQTSTAEFVLLGSGALLASLQSATGTSTLDQIRAASGPVVQVGDGQNSVDAPALDLAHATIAEASGKLGRTGKHVEVTGISAATGLHETLTIEVYDDFPGLALESASFRNA